jgi:hypothetical protein
MGTIVFLTSIWLDQLVKLITSTCLNLIGHVNELVEHVFEPFVSSYVLLKLVHVRPIKIITPLDALRQHVP